MVQEVFLAIYLAAAKFRNDAQLTTWITRTITVNQSRSHVRRRQLRERILAVMSRRARDDRHSAENCGANDTDHAMDPRLARAREGIRRLTPCDREAIVLRYLETMSIEAIAS